MRATRTVYEAGRRRGGLRPVGRAWQWVPDSVTGPPACSSDRKRPERPGVGSAGRASERIAWGPPLRTLRGIAAGDAPPDRRQARRALERIPRAAQCRGSAGPAADILAIQGDPAMPFSVNLGGLGSLMHRSGSAPSPFDAV